MERRIQYATSSDGTTIAYWTLGAGKPLVYMAGGPWNHVELWEVEECRQWYDQVGCVVFSPVDAVEAKMTGS